MTIAERIRLFFDQLVASRRIDLKLTLAAQTLERIADLKQALATTQQSADYFRQRAERLELYLLPMRQPGAGQGQRPPNTSPPVGRKPWPQVVKEHTAQLAVERAAEEKNKKPNGNATT